jgi:hypothetical protein
MLTARPIMEQVGAFSLRDLMALTGTPDRSLAGQLRTAAITHAWQAFGGIRSSGLGLPIGPDGRATELPVIRPLDGGGARADFRGGLIELDPTGRTSGKRTRQADIWFAGIECRIRQESVDEIQGAVGVVVPASHTGQSFAFPESGDPFELGPDGNRIVSIEQRVYQGPPDNVRLHCVLVEHDSGNLDDIRKAVQEAVTEAAKVAGAVLGIPSEALDSDHGFLNTVTVTLTDRIAGALGAGDDLYTPQALLIRADEMLGTPTFTQHTLTRSDDPRALEYTHLQVVTGIDDGGDRGDYAFYFRVALYDIEPILIGHT